MAKYDDLLMKLEDETTYSAGMIVRFAQESGYADTRESLLRIRITLNRKVLLCGFSRTGDGWIRLPGQGPTPGWYGWRWKTLIKKE